MADPVHTRAGGSPGGVAAGDAPWSWRILAAAGLMALLAFVLASAAKERTPFNPDESRWLHRAYFLTALADPFGPTWTDRYMTRGQPPLGSYAMGIGLLLQGRDLDTNGPWNFAVDAATNADLGNMPSTGDLAAGRRTSAGLVALTTLALVAVARTFLSSGWAIAAGGLFAVHPFTIYIGSLAMSDALFGLLIVLAAWAAAYFARWPSWTRGALLGMLLGLGGATKLSPLVVAIGFSGIAALALLVQGIRQRRLSVKDVAASPALAIGPVAALTFVVVYPFLWPDPIGRTRNLIFFRVDEMATQAADWPVMAVPNRAEALHRIGVNFVQHFNLTGSLADWAGLQAIGWPLRELEVLASLAGVIVMGAMALRAGPTSPRAWAFAVLGGQVLVTILGMRSEFDRYHLPMALLGVIAAVIALESLARGVRGLVAPPRGKSDSVQPAQAAITMRTPATRLGFANGQGRDSACGS